MRLILIVGTVTIVVGSLLALIESRVKKVVAYSTLSQMGLGMMVYGSGNLYLGFLGLVAHGFAKSLLFMQVGYLMHLNFGRQSQKKWGRRWVEGVLQVQLLITLFSLCGLSFTSGIVLKEAMLDGLLRIRWRVLTLTLTIIRVYLTFVYSTLIYKSLFVRDLFIVYYNQSRVVILLLSVEVLAVVIFGSYVGSNVITVTLHFSYMEVVVPLVVIILIISLYNSIIIINIYNRWLQYLLNRRRNYPHYVWGKKVILL
jgi:NADH:ubiquinone oxidoreductase subunit 5 (subunit L)/multisubunit Na+/H+ antiporter MnhA subunit